MERAKLKAKKLRLTFDQWLVKLIFGQEGGVVERVNDAYRVDHLDEDGIPTLYIRNKRLNAEEIQCLSSMVLSFCLLTIVAVYDVFLFRVTYTCSDSPGDFCFVSSVNRSENVTRFIFPGDKVTDCQLFNKEGIVNRTVIKCYQWAYDFQGSLIALGGFLALFQLTSRLSLSVSIECATYIIKQSPNLQCVVKTVRVLLATLVGVIELCLAVLYGASFLLDEKYTRVVHLYCNELLLIFGILTTVLWLPLEAYAHSSVQLQDYHHHNTTNTGQVGEQQPLLPIHRSPASSSVASSTHAISQTL